MPSLNGITFVYQSHFRSWRYVCHLGITYQPPPVEITLTPGMSYDELSEEFKQQTYESSRKGKISIVVRSGWHSAAIRIAPREAGSRTGLHSCFREKFLATLEAKFL